MSPRLGASTATGARLSPASLGPVSGPRSLEASIAPAHIGRFRPELRGSPDVRRLESFPGRAGSWYIFALLSRYPARTTRNNRTTPNHTTKGRRNLGN